MAVRSCMSPTAQGPARPGSIWIADEVNKGRGGGRGGGLRFINENPNIISHSF